ncbi:GerW family sporulation protein [Chengkuizengella axinellae]|uniref:GerW family sporulation protein n=1 Tax=Chengkuizengella axinellae TaxID=3064388 RepID=A0ABT9IWP3_9BACL|nr:GerW family sporulation protein [Chengkuizengella sp. 2205SS18-9]MDP5273753.1 GerW family sporulation protein [Chengkuizengella sp. 2205SS18-9]
MEEHPIQGLMKTAMENIKEMVDVNTIIGDPVETPGGSIILPVSRVGFGFAAGGSEFVIHNEGDSEESETQTKMPFGGGAGGGVSIVPIAFLVVDKDGVQLVSLDNQTHLFERIIDSTPHLMEKLQSMFKKEEKKEDDHLHDPEPPMM